MKLKLTLIPPFLNAGMIFINSNNFGKTCGIVKMILGFRSNITFFRLLIKCSLNISDSHLSSKTMQSFPEIIIFLAKMSLFEKGLMVLIADRLLVCQKYFLPDASFGFILGKQSALFFLNNFVQKFLLCFVE